MMIPVPDRLTDVSDVAVVVVFAAEMQAAVKIAVAPVADEVWYAV
jgi:hypothetical protein